MASRTGEREWYAKALLGKTVTIPAAAWNATWKSAAAREMAGVSEFFVGVIKDYKAGRNRAGDKWGVFFESDSETWALKLDILQHYMRDDFPLFTPPASTGTGLPTFILPNPAPA